MSSRPSVDGQHDTGKRLQSKGSIADAMNDALRAPRRSGRSYDYLAAEGDEKRRVPPKKFSYHDTVAPPKHGRSYDYMDEDQNRRPSAGDGVPYRHRRYAVKTHDDNNNLLDSSDDDFSDEIDSEDEKWVESQMAMRRPILPPPQTRKTANPGPIGLLGFGMTTVLLNLHNTGHWPLFSVIPAMGICFGGGAQLIAGLLEFTKGNTFGCVAFTSFGAFWLSLVCVWMLPNAQMGYTNNVQATSSYFLGVYLIIWGLFAFLMMCCTIRMNLGIFLVFLSVTLLFFLLGGANMAGNKTAVKAAGYEGIVCGSLALYLAFAEIINEVWDRTILPIVPFTDLWAKCESKEKEKKINKKNKNKVNTEEGGAAAEEYEAASSKALSHTS